MKSFRFLHLEDAPLARQPALEEEATGEAKIERELCFYAVMANPEVLSKATHHEFQEQWEVRHYGGEKSLKPKGRIRVRQTGIESPQYTQTIKIRQPDGGDMETTMEVSKDFFEQFKLMADTGMRKTRYFFDVLGRSEKWEVDVFAMPDGKLCNYVKMDFEFADGQVTTVPPMPEGFDQAISAVSQDPEDRDLIARLYREVFSVRPQEQ